LFDADLEPAMRDVGSAPMVAPPEGALLFVRSECSEHNWFALTPRARLGFHDSGFCCHRAITDDPGCGRCSRPRHNCSQRDDLEYRSLRRRPLREGRIFLVGDARISCRPTAVSAATPESADAHNLAWKLAAVCPEKPGDALLATNESERQPITEFTLKHVMLRAGRDRPIFPEVRPVRPQSDHAGIRYPMAQP